MKYWTRDELDAGIELPSEFEIITEFMIDIVEMSGEAFPRLIRVGLGSENENDSYMFEFHVEIAPGLVLPMEHGYLELLDEDEEIFGLDHAARSMREGLNVCIPDTERLLAIVHNARVESRKAFAEMNAAGIGARLIDVRLAPYDHWRGETQPSLQIVVEKLDRMLQPKIGEVGVEKPADLDVALAEWREGIEGGYRARMELQAKGATARISRLALNAVAHHGDEAETLRRFASEPCVELSDDVDATCWNGTVGLMEGLGTPKFHWRHDGFAITREFIPDERLKAAVGRPVTELLSHPYLSDDMIVTEASGDLSHGSPAIIISLDMPQLLFCSASGRYWVDTEPATVPTPNVVPFRLRSI